MPTSSLSPFMMTCSRVGRSARSMPLASAYFTFRWTKTLPQRRPRIASTPCRPTARTQILEPTHLSMSSDGSSLLGFSFSSTVFGAASMVPVPFLLQCVLPSAPSGRSSRRSARAKSVLVRRASQWRLKLGLCRSRRILLLRSLSNEK